MKTIAVVTIYIGKLPNWISLWVESVAQNPTIDFFLYSDQNLEGDLPDNLLLKKTDLFVLQKKFSEVLGFDCILPKPYKLCDYKPLYGLAMANDLKNYDFWGYCDIDLIFGDLRKFVTDEILENYDRIFEGGHLSLYKNCEKVNYAYRLPGAWRDYEQVYSSPYNWVFDEHTGMNRIFHLSGWPVYRNVVCADILPHKKAFYMQDSHVIDKSVCIKNYKHQIFCYKNGKTFRVYLKEDVKTIGMDEVSYIHFMWRNPKDAQLCLGKEKYIITDESFVPLAGDIDVDTVLRYDNVQGSLQTIVRVLMTYYKRFIKVCQDGELGIRISLFFKRTKLINTLSIKYQKRRRIEN